MGCHGVRVDDAAALEKAVVGAKSLDTPLVIAAHIDPAQYNSQF